MTDDELKAENVDRSIELANEIILVCQGETAAVALSALMQALAFAVSSHCKNGELRLLDGMKLIDCICKHSKIHLSEFLSDESGTAEEG